MKGRFTQRGFGYIEFRDDNGNYCSLQESSAAQIELEDGTVTDANIWIGVDKDYEGNKLGKEVIGFEGKPTKLGARMHLTQSQVRELLPHLAQFAEFGELSFKVEPEDKSKESNNE